MEELLRTAFCSSFVFYVKAAGFHWNVAGANFPQLHGLFGGIYGEVYDSLDSFAEHIRAAGYPAPQSLAAILENSYISETRELLDAPTMVATLEHDNLQVLSALRAIPLSDPGIANFIAGRIEAHSKHGWMLLMTMRTK